jgi:acyl-CoA thioester hydrolase
VRITEAGRASMSIVQQAWRGDELLAEGSIRIGCIDAGTFRPRRIPNEILHKTP